MRQRPFMPPPPPMPFVIPSNKTTRPVEDRKDDANRPTAPSAGWSERWKSKARRQSKDLPSDPVVPIRPVKEIDGSYKVLHVTVAVLALAVVGLIFQVFSLWVRVNNIGENFCNRHYCIWFFCR
ncbi:hypothetical protein HPB50_022237 [Hyalomma asiaticum]|uniref:Uncharacterized protein n=1 Tax=Hyalomma asiaticum TaxID=266040 RepID=A0ACB7TPC3_HYAAI|nr:hypothetical protein HPB50_022237 [Hyalomma asiaticum]